MLLSGVCDHKARFTNIYVGLPGRMHDAHVFRRSNLYQQLSNQLLPLDLHLIGDAAYPLLPNLMTPFRDTGHLTRSQIIYNMKLSKIRSIIERAFGLLKCKFRRLYFLDISDFELGQKMIVAACILHNFMINRGEIDVEENDIIDNEIVLNNVNNGNENEMDDRNAIVKRNTVMNLFR